MQTKKLFLEFEPTTTEEWEKLILKDLKGANYSNKLTTDTIEGIKIKPYYRKENLFNKDFSFFTDGYTKSISCNISQEIIIDNFIEANIRAIDLLQKGVTSIIFNFNNYYEVNYSDIQLLLNNLTLKKNQIVFKAKSFSKEFINYLQKYLNTTNLNNVDFLFSYSPLSLKTINAISGDNNFNKTITSLLEINNSNIKILNVDASIFKDAGSSSVHELAFGLSIANDYLSIVNDLGSNINDFAPKIYFTFGIGSNYFMEIAKLRAARLLWAKIVEAYNIKDNNSAKMNIHSVTSDWNKTAYDPYVNVLRTTTEAMSAIIGGTDSLLVKPFNSSYEDATDFSERIARNIQIILNEEAYFDKFIDPAGGSYYIENLTNSIIENAWDLFLEVEKLGGYNKAFDSGFIKSQIEETANKRDLAIAMKKEVLLGTNQYSARDEKLKFKIPKSKKVEGNAIRTYRGAEAFEELRQRTEKAKKSPKVLLLIFGNLAMRKARASFATNFFACAGFEIVENDAVTSAEEALNQINEVKADVIVFCSSDDEYFNFASEIYKEIEDKTILTIAGYPKNNIEEFQNIGIENFIHVKSNILETLTKFQNIILQK